MNKAFMRFFAAALALAAAAGIAGCDGGKKTEGNEASASLPSAVPTETSAAVTTDAPTEAPTEEPTEAPTEEPTATPIPWPTDPTGVIPPEVEIFVMADQPGYCITKVDGKTVLQYWKESKVIPNKQWEVPEEFLNVYGLQCSMNYIRQGDIFMAGDITGSRFAEFWFYYQDAEGRTLFFECNSIFPSPYRLIIATTDSKAIYYIVGEDFYKMHDFGEGAYVEVDGDAQLSVNGWGVDLDTIIWEKVTI